MGQTQARSEADSAEKAKISAEAERQASVERFHELDEWADRMCRRYAPRSGGYSIGFVGVGWDLAVNFTMVYSRESDKDEIVLDPPPFPDATFGICWIRKQMPDDERYEVDIQEIVSATEEGDSPSWCVPDGRELGFVLTPRMFGLAWTMRVDLVSDIGHTFEGDTLTFVKSYVPQAAVRAATSKWVPGIKVPWRTKTINVVIRWVDKSGIPD